MGIFSKELEDELIPEWREAFVDYWQLKEQLERINSAKVSKKHFPGFRQYIVDHFRHISRKISLGSTAPDTPDIALEVRSQVNSGEDDDGVEDGGQVNLREDVDGGEDRGVHDRSDDEATLFSEDEEVKKLIEMFERELKKVNEFYRAKEVESVARGDILNTQLKTLLNLRQPVNHGPTESDSLLRHDSEGTEDVGDQSQTDAQIVTEPSRARQAGIIIDIPATTPTRTVAALTSCLTEDVELGERIPRKKTETAEKMIRDAYIELYRSLGLLTKFSSLNMMAFTKIIKKFNKVIPNHPESTRYIEEVKASDFNTSDKVVKLMDEVEALFTEHFVNQDRKRAIKFLRPQLQKDSHMVTFFVGLFTGSFTLMFAMYVLLARVSGMFSSETQSAYMESIYPIFSMFTLLSLHLFMYGCNLFMWKRTRINYSFILEFRPNNSLKYRDAFLICASLMTICVGAMILHLVLLSAGFSSTQVDRIPVTLLLLFIGILICPFRVCYRPTRYFFLRVLRNIVFSPFYKVLIVDFFLADQLTSQIPLLRHMQSVACHAVFGRSNADHYSTCKTGKVYMELSYVLSFAPYYWRAMQCLRRWFDERNTDQLANLGKYVSAIVAAGARLTYARQQSTAWMLVVLMTSLVATAYQLYWDFIKDWGLLNRRSRNPWLRDDLVLKNRSIYYVSIVFNFVLRIAWVETVMRFDTGLFRAHMLDFLLASLEIIRRGHWNFYRLENEHLNNVGKFRAVKAVPLPFRDIDSD